VAAKIIVKLPGYGPSSVSDFGHIILNLASAKQLHKHADEYSLLSDAEIYLPYKIEHLLSNQRYQPHCY
jgi:hypothetical protein